MTMRSRYLHNNTGGILRLETEQMAIIVETKESSVIIGEGNSNRTNGGTRSNNSNSSGGSFVILVYWTGKK